MAYLKAHTMERRVRRGWFAETLVVLGILAFAFFAMVLYLLEAGASKGFTRR